MVALDSWSYYTVTILWKLAWGDSTLVILDGGSSYRGGRLNRFACTLQMDTKLARLCLATRRNFLALKNCEKL